jgi:hypothetical protein
VIDRRYATTQIVCLYPAGSPLVPELVDWGQRIITTGVLTNRHFILPDQAGAAAVWATHARRIGAPVTRFGYAAAPHGAWRDYYRIVGTRTPDERDLMLFDMADVVHLFGPPRSALPLFKRVRALGRHVFWHDGYATIESKTPA